MRPLRDHRRRAVALTGAIPQASFNRVEPVVEKVRRSSAFRLRLVSYRGMARHGVISAGMKVPEIACWTKLEITPPSNSHHSRYGTHET